MNASRIAIAALALGVAMGLSGCFTYGTGGSGGGQCLAPAGEDGRDKGGESGGDKAHPSSDLLRKFGFASGDTPSQSTNAIPVSIAFPRQGSYLPVVKRCYAIGAADTSLTNVIVNGKPVPVTKSGAWATMIDVVTGENRVTVSDGRTTATHKFGVGTRVKGAKAATNDVPAVVKAKTYGKLDYVGERRLRQLKGLTPGEIRVVVDAGHGGADGGAVSPHGWEEKEANLLLAAEIVRQLRERGFTVITTRDDDRAVQLYDRPRVAHGWKADAFISVHHNAPPCDVDPLRLKYKAVYSWNDLGSPLAGAIADRLGARNLHANYAVTRNTETPSCLIEAGFITHPLGETAAWSPDARKLKAARVVAGFEDWCRAQGVKLEIEK